MAVSLSSWLHQILLATNCYLGPRRCRSSKLAFRLVENVSPVSTHDIFETRPRCSVYLGQAMSSRFLILYRKPCRVSSEILVQQVMPPSFCCSIVKVQRGCKFVVSWVSVMDLSVASFSVQLQGTKVQHIHMKIQTLDIS